MKYQKINTFTIAHYIFLFFVVVFCIGIVAWTLTRSGKSVAADTNNDNVIRVTQNISPCAQKIINQVSQIWAYNPELIPSEYLDMANEYVNSPVAARTRGECNNVKFTCRAGDVRRDCDPCALGTARQMAMERQIADMTAQYCK